MDIVKGSLDDISRPASVSRSCPGSRISNSRQAEKSKIIATFMSLEVLTPEPCLRQEQWGLKKKLNTEKETPKMECHEGENSQGMAEIRPHSEQDRDNAMLESPNLTGELESESDSYLCKEEFENKGFDYTTAGTDEINQAANTGHPEDTSELPVNTEQKTDPKLLKAIKKMKALDEILLKKVANEKEIKAQGVAMRKQLWEELQIVSLQSSARSPDENLNTNKFLALTQHLDDTAGGTSVFEETVRETFYTQLPSEECDYDDTKGLQGNASGRNSSGLKSDSEYSYQRPNGKKSDNRKGVDFIQRNIELVKESGSHVLLMDDEKLRLEQLLGDIQDGCSEDSITADASLWLVPCDAFSPEPGELEQLAAIEAQLQRFTITTEAIDTEYHPEAIDIEYDHRALTRQSKLGLSMDKLENAATSPGEKVLRYTKELREEKIRLKEIDQQLEDIMRSSTAPLSLSSSTTLLSGSSVHIY
ncbi:fibrous sheath-interacting protein 1 [Hyperolius riggenbachi]|uniref:fibrous sheath-interacting protein 1 n=1 Tax=Hyperolius riggenbachi TaxID=752182 RepID=UPI0035A3A534